MKFISIILLIFFSNTIFANEENKNEVEVINLYESKSLDQMVLDNLNDGEETKDSVESINENQEVISTKVEIKQIEILRDNFIRTKDSNDLKSYLQNDFFKKLVTIANYKS